MRADARQARCPPRGRLMPRFPPPSLNPRLPSLPARPPSLPARNAPARPAWAAPAPTRPRPARGAPGDVFLSPRARWRRSPSRPRAWTPAAPGARGTEPGGVGSAAPAAASHPWTGGAGCGLARRGRRRASGAVGGYAKPRMNGEQRCAMPARAEGRRRGARKRSAPCRTRRRRGRRRAPCVRDRRAGSPDRAGGRRQVNRGRDFPNASRAPDLLPGAAGPGLDAPPPRGPVRPAVPAPPSGAPTSPAPSPGGFGSRPRHTPVRPTLPRGPSSSASRDGMTPKPQAAFPPRPPLRRLHRAGEARQRTKGGAGSAGSGVEGSRSSPSPSLQFVGLAVPRGLLPVHRHGRRIMGVGRWPPRWPHPVRWQEGPALALRDGAAGRQGQAPRRGRARATRCGVSSGPARASRGFAAFLARCRPGRALRATSPLRPDSWRRLSRTARGLPARTHPARGRTDTVFDPRRRSP